MNPETETALNGYYAIHNRVEDIAQILKLKWDYFNINRDYITLYYTDSDGDKDSERLPFSYMEMSDEQVVADYTAAYKRRQRAIRLDNAQYRVDNLKGQIQRKQREITALYDGFEMSYAKLELQRLSLDLELAEKELEKITNEF